MKRRPKKKVLEIELEPPQWTCLKCDTLNAFDDLECLYCEKLEEYELALEDQ